MEFEWPPRWRGSHEDWEAIKHRFPLGSWAEGAVIARQPFGVFIDLGNSALGLMETPALPQPNTDEQIEPPAVGSQLGGFVIRRRDSNFQVELVSRKPGWSVLQGARPADVELSASLHAELLREAEPALPPTGLLF